MWLALDSSQERMSSAGVSDVSDREASDVSAVEDMASGVQALSGLALASAAVCEGQGEAHDTIRSTRLGSASVDDDIGCSGVSGSGLGSGERPSQGTAAAQV